jgi:hypothetical protein
MALRLISAKRTRSSTCSVARAVLLLQQVDDVLLALDEAGRHVGGLVHDVLARHRPGDHDVAAVARDGDGLAREERLHLARELAQVALHVTSYRRMPPARSHTNIEIVPGALPCTSSCCCDVTMASATSGLVSDTRVMPAATLNTAERPTRMLTSLVSASPGAGAAAAGLSP